MFSHAVKNEKKNGVSVTIIETSKFGCKVYIEVEYSKGDPNSPEKACQTSWVTVWVWNKPKNCYLQGLKRTCLLVEITPVNGRIELV